jgi:putative redox protein
MRRVTISWDPELERFEAEGTHPGRRIVINGAHDAEPTGFSPTELLLAGAGACSAWDVVEIMRKKRRPLDSLVVEVDGEQEPEPPRAYRTLTLRFRASGEGIERAVLERAVRLSIERYCSVLATVRGVAEVRTEIEVAPAG